jgi:hypothetical protein
MTSRAEGRCSDDAYMYRCAVYESRRRRLRQIDTSTPYITVNVDARVVFRYVLCFVQILYVEILILETCILITLTTKKLHNTIVQTHFSLSLSLSLNSNFENSKFLHTSCVPVPIVLSLSLSLSLCVCVCVCLSFCSRSLSLSFSVCVSLFLSAVSLSLSLSSCFQSREREDPRWLVGCEGCMGVLLYTIDCSRS